MADRGIRECDDCHASFPSYRKPPWEWENKSRDGLEHYSYVVSMKSTLLNPNFSPRHRDICLECTYKVTARILSRDPRLMEALKRHAE